MSDFSINTVLDHIDDSDLSYYETLSDEDKKKFSPYMALRWMTCVSDSVVLKYKANVLEQYIGKWKDSGKKTASDIVAAFNETTGIPGGCLGVAKVGETKYDWYITFSVDNKDTATKLAGFIESIIGSCPSVITQTMDDETHNRHLVVTNNIVNVNFYDTATQHPEMSYKLLCIASAVTGCKKTRSWFPMVKSTNDNLLLAFFKNYLREPCLRLNELPIIINSMTRDDFINALESTDIVPKSDHKKYIELYERDKNI